MAWETEVENNIFRRNIGDHLQDYKVSQPRRPNYELT
jgi:hypothetical protein